jgi:hypothetical protein
VIVIVCVLFPIIAAQTNKRKTQKCSSCDNDIGVDPAAIYIPTCTLALKAFLSAAGIHFWASKLKVSRQSKWLMVIIGLLLPIVSHFLPHYLHFHKGYFQSSPEIQELHAIEPGAQPQALDPSSLQQSSPEIQLHAIECDCLESV